MIVRAETEPVSPLLPTSSCEWLPLVWDVVRHTVTLQECLIMEAFILLSSVFWDHNVDVLNIVTGRAEE